MFEADKNSTPAKLVIITFVISILVLISILFIRSNRSGNISENNETISVSSDDFVEEEIFISDLFENRKPPTPFIPVDTADENAPTCMLDGVLMQEGSVSTNTVCVNYRPTATPQSMR